MHVHEKVEEMRKLLAIQLMKLEVLSLSDAVVLAAEDLRQDLVEVFGFLPERVMNFGIAVDAEEIDRLAHEGEPEAQTASANHSSAVSGWQSAWSDMPRNARVLIFSLMPQRAFHSTTSFGSELELWRCAGEHGLFRIRQS